MSNQSKLPPEFIKGIEEFNRQEFFECHETLEGLWRKQEGPNRQFTQGIIQIAVGYHHLLRNNQKGALKLLTAGLAKINPYSPNHLGIDVSSLTATVASSLAEARVQESTKLSETPKIRFT